MASFFSPLLKERVPGQPRVTLASVSLPWLFSPISHWVSQEGRGSLPLPPSCSCSSRSLWSSGAFWVHHTFPGETNRCLTGEEGEGREGNSGIQWSHSLQHCTKQRGRECNMGQGGRWHGCREGGGPLQMAQTGFQGRNVVLLM